MTTGDTVKVLDGKGKGSVGQVIDVLPSGESNKLLVRFKDGTEKVFRNFELSLLPKRAREAV